MSGARRDGEGTVAIEINFDSLLEEENREPAETPFPKEAAPKKQTTQASAEENGSASPAAPMSTPGDFHFELPDFNLDLAENAEKSSSRSPQAAQPELKREEVAPSDTPMLSLGSLGNLGELAAPSLGELGGSADLPLSLGDLGNLGALSTPSSFNLGDLSLQSVPNGESTPVAEVERTRVHEELPRNDFFQNNNDATEPSLDLGNLEIGSSLGQSQESHVQGDSAAEEGLEEPPEIPLFLTNAGPLATTPAAASSGNGAAWETPKAATPQAKMSSFSTQEQQTNSLQQEMDNLGSLNSEPAHSPATPTQTFQTMEPQTRTSHTATSRTMQTTTSARKPQSRPPTGHAQPGPKNGFAKVTAWLHTQPRWKVACYGCFGAFALAFLLFEAGDLLSEPEIEMGTTVVSKTAVPPPAPHELKKAKGAAVAQQPKISKEAPKLAAKPVAAAKAEKETPTVQGAHQESAQPLQLPDAPPPLENVLANSPNAPYFGAIDKAIVAGDPIGAVKSFRARLQSPLTKAEKAIAAEHEARYYFLTSSAAKARDALAPYCPQLAENNVTVCLNLMRALISTGEFKLASPLINSALELANSEGTTSQWKNYSTVVELLDLANKALAKPSVRNSLNLVDHLVHEFTLNAEWYRQRTIWLARSIVLLPTSERATVTRVIHNDRRTLITNALDNAEKAGIATQDPLLIPFLAYLANQFDTQPLAVQGGRIRFESDISFAASTFKILGKAVVDSSENLYASLTALSKQGAFDELGKLIAMNIAMHQGDWRTAFRILSDRPKAAQFGYEWAFAYSRAALQTPDQRSWREALRLVGTHGRDPIIQNDVYFQLLHARIQRLTKQNNSASLNLAQKFAVTQQERAATAVEQMLSLRSTKPQAAVAILKQALSQYPHNGLLLQAAVESVGLVGEDPAPYIEQQTALPEKYLQSNLEFPLLSQATVRKILFML